MLKERIKSTLCGVIIGAILTGGIASAYTTHTLYGVMTNGIRIVIDGKEIEPTDANGNIVEPAIYEGTTYLPVRAVAQAFGKAVYWDGQNYTVYLGDMDGELEYPTVELRDMKNISGGFSTTSKLTDNYGTRYKYGESKNNFTGGLEEYLLNMQYSRFKGILYVPEGTTKDGDLGYVSIEADGRTIYTSDALHKASRPIEIDVDTTGCNEFKITFNGFEGCLVLGNAGFYQ